jgi:uncharacterized protein (TIGR03083 family)
MDVGDRARLDAMLEALDGFQLTAGAIHDGDWARPTGCPGWNVHDVVAHVVGIEAVLTGNPEPHVDLPADLPHVRDEFGAYVERHVQARRDLAAPDLIAELDEVFARRRERLAGDLTVPTPTFFGAMQPLVKTLGMRTFDIYAHEQDVRRAVAQPGHLGGAAPKVFLERSLRGLERILPERIGTRGAVVTLAVTGEQVGAITVDLCGDGEAATSPATVRVELDFADLVPLVCGRSDAPDPGRVAAVQGDEALAADVLTGLTLTP